MGAPPAGYLSASTFAARAGISERKAREALRRCHAGQLWRGHRLEVVATRGRGGRSGLVYHVREDTLPVELTQAQPAPATNTLPADPGAEDTSAWQVRLPVIRPVLAHPKGSNARAAAVSEQARAHGVGERTVRQWVREYEECGIGGLTRKARSDRGASRYHVGRRWDRAVPFEDDTKRAIAERVRQDVRNLWRSGARGWRHVQRFATRTLIQATREAGLDWPEGQLAGVCEVPRQLIEAERKDFAPLAVKEGDAKRFFDQHLPRTRRNRAALRPMDVVALDIHHMDVLYERWEEVDGQQVRRLITPKLIAFQDLATNRIFWRLKFCAPRESVRLKDVAQAFIEDVCLNPEAGVPRTMLIDNGSEVALAEFIDDALQLAQWAQRMDVYAMDAAPDLASEARQARSAVIKSRPYNAPAKPIEGLFGVLESGGFAMLPGWIGGNRMKKKTQNVGKEPIPFQGSEADYGKAVQTVFDDYHNTRQIGFLDGRTPNQAYAAWVEAGWRRTDADRDSIEAAFAREKTRTVHQGEITIGGVSYRHDALLGRAGRKVTVREPVTGAGDHIAVLEDGSCVCWAERTPQYSFLDPAGAKDQARRRKTQNAIFAARASQTQRVDLTERMREFASAAPQLPIAESAGVIRFNPEIEAAGAAKKALPDPETEQQRREDQARQRSDAFARIADRARAVGED